jgi:exodeoxyribonuclease VII small subunit
MASSPASAGEVPFEKALADLEAIVERMESSELPLETLLAEFEQGTRLARICQTQLAAAEVRIRQLEKDLGGELQTRPADLDAEEPG